MDFSSLPAWPRSLPGETRQSWLRAAGQLQPIDEEDWWELVQPSHREPERPSKEASWDGLPAELGDISSIVPMWRLAPQRRQVFCPYCFVSSDGVKRWPTLISWIDARQLECRSHKCALVYRDPAFGIDRGHAECQKHPELLELYYWTHHWLHIEHSTSLVARNECRWRNDLVHMISRNWTPARSHSAAGLGAWELWRMGWYAQESGGLLGPGAPGRLGELSAPERLGSLLLAYRAWRCFRKEIAVIPPLPRIAWAWLARRWERRLGGSQRSTFVSLIDNLMKNS